MFLRRTAIAVVCFIGISGAVGPAIAQFMPPPVPPGYVPPPFRPLPPIAVEEEDVPGYELPPVYRGSRALPPPIDEPTYVPPSGQYGRVAPPQSERYPSPYPPPPAGIYREPPPYEPADPPGRVGAMPVLPTPLDILRPPG